VYSVEHRKLGLGLFALSPKEKEEQAERIVNLIWRGVKYAKPYFTWRADRASKTSKLNVTNNSTWLYERYKFLRDGFRQKTMEAEARRNERNITKSSDGTTTTYHFPSWKIKQEAGLDGFSGSGRFL
jgi:hypothetical protein